MQLRRIAIHLFAFIALMNADAFGAEDNKAGILELEVTHQDSDALALANTITRNVRSIIRGQRRWRDVGKLSATLTDAREAFGCSETDMTCMRNLAKTLGLDVLVWGTLTRTSFGYSLTLLGTSASGKNERIEDEFSAQTIKRSPSQSTLNAMLNQKIRPMLERLMLMPEHTTQVHISTEPVGAEITINDQAIGTSPQRIALREGSYVVHISADGFVPLREELIIKKAPQQKEKWLLSPMTELGIADSSPQSSREIIRWTSLGVSLTAFASAAYLFSSGTLLKADTVDRLQCNDGVYLNPMECGTSIAPLSRQEHGRLKSRYETYRFIQVGSYVLSGVASATFASTFFF